VGDDICVADLNEVLKRLIILVAVQKN